MDSSFLDLISKAKASDPAASDQLFAALYAELRRLAEHHLRKNDPGLSLGTTTLLHEAYLNIAGRDGLAFPDRGLFLGYASRAMRGLVIDYARARRALKRGRQFEITLTEEIAPSAEEAGTDLAALGDALDELARIDPSLSELVDLHFFCGFSFVEIAGFRGVSDRTVQRDWRKARLLLKGTMEFGKGPPRSP